MKTLILMVALSYGHPQPPAQRQDGFWWKQLGIATLHLVAGFATYQNEITLHNWAMYKRRHPSANPYWWWPRLSENNKWKDRDPSKGPAFPGSTTWLVGVTDKYHFNRLLRNAFVAGGTALSMTLWVRPRWQHIVLQLLFNWATFAAGTGIGHIYYYRK